MEQGWIKLYRKITDNPLYFSEPFTRLQAWLDLLLLANYKDSFYMLRGIQVNIKRGEVGWSADSLAKRWKWSRGKVIRFFANLERTGNIVQQKSNVINIISITNYTHYQADDTTDSTTDGQQTDTNKNIKKDNKVNNSTNTKLAVLEKTAENEKIDFIQILLTDFCLLFADSRDFEFDLTTAGKERKAIGKLLNMYKKKNPNNNSDIARADFINIWKRCLQVQDKFLYDNMSPAIILSKWNTLKTILKTQTDGKKSKQFDEQWIANIASHTAGSGNK